MGIYRTAEVCPNGHVSTKSADVYPELREPFCSKCGEATSTQCPGCGTDIRGDYFVEGIIGFGQAYEPPAYCFNCGGAFPWTVRKLTAAVELVEVKGELSEAEIHQFRTDLADLTKDTPVSKLHRYDTKR